MARVTYPGWTDVLGQKGLVHFEADRLVVSYLVFGMFPSILQQLVPRQARRRSRRGHRIITLRRQQKGQSARRRGMVIGRHKLDVDTGYAEQRLPLEARR